MTSDVSTHTLGPRLSPDNFPWALDPACLHFLTNHFCIKDFLV